MKVTEAVAIDHGLKKEEFSKICELLKRTPNLTELAIFSAMWNEHCSYKSSRKHLKKMHTKGKQVIQGPGEMPVSSILEMMMQLYLKLKAIITHHLLNLIKVQQLELVGLCGMYLQWGQDQ